ncbi:hypothetical protein CEXT_263651 [Caerostris extrusa]|uniref:Uncharacterized protein n=1 Tax=Caerostris extrusa TaxID=172846 RepID=A0AAV4W492_CAEEX|nr:hypothetical protein CEXT_263651 [Caerostris extrusa]
MKKRTKAIGFSFQEFIGFLLFRKRDASDILYEISDGSTLFPGFLLFRKRDASDILYVRDQRWRHAVARYGISTQFDFLKSALLYWYLFSTLSVAPDSLFRYR